MDDPLDLVLDGHQSMLYDALTAGENLRFVARLHGIVDRVKVDALLERIGLLHVRDERISTFSRGMLQMAETLLEELKLN